MTVRQDDSGEVSRRRADLEAQLRALEEKRDRLEEQLAARRLEPAHQAGGMAPDTVEASILRTLENLVTAVQPILGMATSAREGLIADHAEATRGNDGADVNEVTKLLNEVDVVFVELAGAVGRLNSLAETIRASMRSDGGKTAKDLEAS